MRTDVVLVHVAPVRRTVTNTKFIVDRDGGLVSRGDAPERLRLPVYAYLRSRAGLGEPFADSAIGLLLHPSVGADVDETAIVQGHAIRFATVDLTTSTSSVRSRLLHLCETAFQGGQIFGSATGS